MSTFLSKSGGSPPSFLGARLLEPIPFVFSETFDQRTPGVNFTERKKTAAERKRDHRAKERAKEKALLEEIKKSQQAQSDRYVKETEEHLRQLLGPIHLTQEAKNDDEEELYGTAPWRIGVYANFGAISDSGGGFWAHGNVGPRTYKKKIPLWAYSESSIRELIEKSFPNLKTSKSERDSAGRWAAVINLYFRNGYTRSQIAHEIGSSDCKISGVIRSIHRAAKGLRANGKGPRSTYRQGKHPNSRRKPKSNVAAKIVKAV